MPNRAAGTALLKRHLLQVVDVLRELRLTYMVIGAFALPAWGRPRATLDIDFIIQTDSWSDFLIQKLQNRGFHLDEEFDRYNPMIREFHKRFRSGRTAVDLLLTRDDHDGAAFSRRQRKRFNGRYLWFPSAEDLLLQKLKVGRSQDLIDAAGIVERMRGKLDQRYLTYWGRKLGISAELSHVFSSTDY